MRIAILANAASPHTLRWAIAYAARGHEVHVVSIRQAEIPGVTTHRVGIGPAGSRKPWWSLLSYLRLLATTRRRLRTIGPDVVHAHYTVTYGVIGAMSGHRPLVVTVWGSDLLRGDETVGWFGRQLNRFAMRRADAVTAASRFLAEAAERVAADGREVRRVPFGVDTDLFRPGRPSPPGSFTVGFVKHLEHRYAPEVLVEAFVVVRQKLPQARLILAGGGSRRGAIEALVSRLGVADAVDMPGAVPHSDVPALLNRCDVLVNPSRSESFGVVMLEAAACGVAVVATRVGGTDETVINGTTGLLVPVDDSSALAAAILDLAGDPERRRSMGVAGRHMVVRRYSWEDSVDRMLSLFESQAA